MNQEQLERIQNDPGFIAALDQSGGSTPKALEAYGIAADQYDTEEEMFDLVHEMRSRIITSPAFTRDRILGAILFQQTMDRKIGNLYTADYLWQQGIVPFVKIDQGLAPLENGVQLMKPLTNLDELLSRSQARHIFGTKMRSNILEYNEAGIQAVVDQQFDVAQEILAAGLMPIIEPEVNINASDKAKIESFLRDEILDHLDQLAEDQQVMLKLTIPTTNNLYQPLIDHPRVARVVALSGGYSTDLANDLLSQNTGMIASFSRALSQDLRHQQSDSEFNETLDQAIEAIYQASCR